MLLDFVKKNRSEVVLTQIVYQELESIYEREIRRLLKEYRKGRAILERRLINSTIHDIEIEIGNAISKYLAHVCQKLNVSNIDIIPYNNSYLPEIVERATKRKRPCSNKGEEFRDVLLWMTLLDLAETLQSVPVVFISGNTREFADKDKNLHPDLIEELEQRNISIDYYDSLDKFLKEHAAKYEFITEEWVLEAVDTDLIKKEIDALLDISGKVHLSRWLDREDSSFSEFLNAHLVGINEIRDFYVYEMSDGSIRITTTFISEIEIEYSVSEEVEEEYWEWGYGFDPQKGDFDFGHILKTGVREHKNYKYAYTEILAEAHLILVDQKISESEIIDLELT